jgi:GT2 family glycosyltransferase
MSSVQVQSKLSVVVPATNAPPTLPRCLEAIRAAEEPPEEIVVVVEPWGASPAHARNLGAARARGDVVVFVDADVEVHDDAFARIRRAFANDVHLTAVFGSYDDHPGDPGLVSSFRNLLHHHVHQSSPGPATTFWAGLGAVRREVFIRAGGFDEQRFRRASIEDVELGLRLSDAGAAIQLDPDVLGTHLKRWTLTGMIKSDLLDRGIPWASLLAQRRRASRALNLGWRHRLSALAAVGVVVGASLRRWEVAVGCACVLVVLNVSFYRLMLRRRGPLGALGGVGLHLVHQLTAAVALPAGIAHHALQRVRRQDRAASSSS